MDSLIVEKCVSIVFKRMEGQFSISSKYKESVTLLSKISKQEEKE